MRKKVIFKELGLIDYAEGHDLQKEIFDKTVSLKVQNRKRSGADQWPTENHLLFCQHQPVYTLGRSGDQSNLLINEATLKAKGAQYFETGRGGDITFHGPGQLVGYPIFDLDLFFTDIHKYLRYLEEAVILTLADYNLVAGRIDGLTGVWLDHVEQKRPRKICAMGVKASRWVTMHGFALNVNTDLSFFNNIVPCGISDKAVTSMELELGEVVDFEKVEERMLFHLSELFEFEIVE